MKFKIRIRIAVYLVVLLGGAVKLIAQSPVATPTPEKNPANNGTADEATTLSRQINEVVKAGKYAEALPLALRAVVINESKYGADSEKLDHSLFDAGTLLETLNENERAREYFLRIIKVYTGKPNVSPVSRATVYYKLGQNSLRQTNNKEAVEMLTSARELIENDPKGDKSLLASVNFSLVDAYFAQKKYTEAEDSFERALVIQESLVGSENSVFQANLKQFGCMRLTHDALTN